MISPCLASFLIFSLIFSFVSKYIAFFPLSFKIFVISSDVILCLFTSLDAYILVAIIISKLLNDYAKSSLWFITLEYVCGSNIAIFLFAGIWLIPSDNAFISVG